MARSEALSPRGLWAAVGWIASRIFRYELRRWRVGQSPMWRRLSRALGPITTDVRVARRILELVPFVPTPVWGRDELGAGEMWNSNSVISWLIDRSGLSAELIRPPVGGRAPGWNAGLVVARRSTMSPGWPLPAPVLPSGASGQTGPCGARRAGRPLRRKPPPHGGFSRCPSMRIAGIFKCQRRVSHEKNNRSRVRRLRVGEARAQAHMRARQASRGLHHHHQRRTRPGAGGPSDRPRSTPRIHPSCIARNCSTQRPCSMRTWSRPSSSWAWAIRRT